MLRVGKCVKALRASVAMEFLEREILDSVVELPKLYARTFLKVAYCTCGRKESGGEWWCVVSGGGDVVVSGGEWWWWW